MKKIIALLLTTMSTVAFSAQLEVNRTNLRANVPGSDNTAAYAVLDNLTKEDVRIVKVESDVSEFTELHTHSMKNDRMIMRKVDYIDVDAEETVYLAPNGYHIMLIKLKQRVKHGEIATITLHYDDGTSQAVKFNVIDPRKLSN
ncbi:copper chaperone PCu(A)C [Marinomonas sp. C2222]|uniref:Copper chaperone PCu(A)C n=1 Tax=Marinomonas sargassi TaxID=2984494 RepID=A0ABT2YTU1_9GAMM|nr:copper chaperone PCu(A)C [Marinomonas sargassi]MCV2403285.1 copper chaperone PCu(A)C [Marinomonas sargassi]